LNVLNFSREIGFACRNRIYTIFNLKTQEVDDFFSHFYFLFCFHIRAKLKKVFQSACACNLVFLYFISFIFSIKQLKIFGVSVYVSFQEIRLENGIKLLIHI